MPTPSRNYHVIADDTDDYLERTTGRGKRDPINDSSRNEVRPLVSDKPRRQKQTRATYAARVAHAVLSVGFGAAGLVCLVTTVGTFDYFQFLYPEAFWVPIGAAAVAMLHTFVGLLAAWKKFTIARMISSVCFLCLAAFGFAGTVATLRIADGHVPESMSTKWNATVNHHEKQLCEFQEAFDCRGWVTVCNETNNFTPPPPHGSTTAAATTATPISTVNPTPSTLSTTLWPGVPMVVEEWTFAPNPTPPDSGSSASGSGSTPGPKPSPTPTPDSGSGSSGSGPGPLPTRTSESKSTRPPHETTTTTFAPSGTPRPSPTSGHDASEVTYACATCSTTTSAAACRDAFVANVHSNRVATVCGLLAVAIVALLGLASVVVATCATVDVAAPGTF